MPLDAASDASQTTAIGAGLLDLARAIRSILPRRGATAKDGLFLDYWGWSLVLRLVEALREKAKRAAVAGGVLPDHLVAPYPVGTAAVVYASGIGSINLKVVEQADRVDVPGLVADLTVVLERAGVKPAVLKRLVRKHTKSFPGAHVFTAVLG